jgi:hypothetical protein
MVNANPRRIFVRRERHDGSFGSPISLDGSE